MKAEYDVRKISSAEAFAGMLREHGMDLPVEDDMAGIPFP